MSKWDEPTCKGSVGDDDTLYCEACGEPVKEKDAIHPILCLKCAAIDEQTDLMLEREHFDPGLD